MSRRSDQLDRIEAALHRLEQMSGEQSEQAAAVRAEVRTARSSADAALAGVQALAGARTAPESPQAAAGGDTGTAGGPVTPARRTAKPRTPRAAPAERM